MPLSAQTGGPPTPRVRPPWGGCPPSSTLQCGRGAGESSLMRGVFSSGRGWGSELSFGQPPSAYDLGVGEGSRGRGSMSKDILFSSHGDPGAPTHL